MSDDENNKKIEELRARHLAETESVAKKQRFALFSSPPPLCVGENAKNKRTFPSRDDNGRVRTLPRNFQISHPKEGKIKSSYFSDSSYITIGDLYYDPERLDRLKKIEEKKNIPADKGIFRPANFYKTIVKPAYKHESDFNLVKKNYRDADGRVILPPKNIITGPEYKPLYKSYGHMTDDYESERKLRREDRLKHVEKMKEHAPFRNMDHGNRAFVKDSKTYGLDGKLPEKSPKKEVLLNIAQHDGPFRPSHPPRKGHNKTIAPFPKYMGDPLKPLQRKDLTKTKDAFKTCHSGNLSRPTPSITSHPINIRREIVSTSNLIK